MADFFTRVQIEKPPFLISYQNKVFFIGSCFSDYIGSRMNELRFKVCLNPFGVLYNPLSIASNLELLADKKLLTENDLSNRNELWFSYRHYTLFSHTDKETCLNTINESLLEAQKFLAATDVMFITLGTSWVYRLKETGCVVANCHKQADSYFERNFLSAEESFEVLKHCINRIREINPAVHFAFTVSPIRHWKDGAVGNQRSKAALTMAIAKLQEWCDEVYYFPAYEIFMDELRDYRFYAADMLHPSESSQTYIWEKFTENLIFPNDIPIMRDVERIITSVKHKPYFPATREYRNFKQSIAGKAEKLMHKYPFLDMNDLIG